MLTEQILQSVLAGQTELGFCGDYHAEGEYRQLERKFLFEEELVLIIPPDHPMSTVETIRPQEFSLFKKDGFISFRNVQSGGVYEAYIKLCRQCPEYPAISMYAQDDHAIIANVRAGMGIALVPCSKWLPLPGVHVIHFAENVPVRGQYMVWEKEAFLSPVSSPPPVIKKGESNDKSGEIR